MASIGTVVSEKKFENEDDRGQMPGYTLSSSMSLKAEVSKKN